MGKKLSNDEVKRFVIKNIKNNCKQAILSQNPLGFEAMQQQLKQWNMLLKNNYYNPKHINDAITALDKEIVALQSYFETIE